jgi:hypothetical protein
MDLAQREHLAEDWVLADKILLAHRAFLCREFKSLKHHSKLGLLLHAARCAFNEHPTVWTGVGALLAVVAVGSLLTLLVLG